MATKLEANSRNGTLSINQQTLIQREKFSSTFNGLGVSSTNFRNMFPSSPIGTSDDVDPVSRNGSNDRSGLYKNDSSNVYDAFQSVVDPDYGTERNGFGFEGLDTAYLNYDHPDNPFLDTTDYTELTSGSSNESQRTYAGHPDLIVPESALATPSTLNDTAPASDTSLTVSPNDNYGHTSSEYRSEINGLFGMLGSHIPAGEGNGTKTSDKLGKYFKHSIVTPD